MEGAAKATKQRLDLAYWQAWHTEAFARMEGRHFKEALNRYFDADTQSAATLKSAQAIAFFHRIQAQGVSVEITRH